MLCFPVLSAPIATRDAKSNIIVGWTPCRGAFVLPQSQAAAAASGEAPITSMNEVVYRCPRHRTQLTASGLLGNEVRRCTYTTRRDRIGNYHPHDYGCDPQYDSMVQKELLAKANADENRSEVFTARILRAQTVMT